MDALLIIFSLVLLILVSDPTFAANATSLRVPLIRVRMRNTDLPSCWERISTGRKLREEYLVRILPLPSLEQCKKECENALFDCETITYGTTDIKGQANCMLSDWKDTLLDIAEKDAELDSTYSIFSRHGSNCVSASSSTPNYATGNQGLETQYQYRPSGTPPPISVSTGQQQGSLCFSLVASGRRLGARYVDKSTTVISIEECRLLCARETSFDCKSFGYRKRAPTLSPNCDLSRENSRTLDLSSAYIFYDDIDSEFYERTGKGRDCDHRPTGYLWSSGSNSPYTGLQKYYGSYGYGGVGGTYFNANEDLASCFRRAKAGTRLDRGVVRYSMAVRSQSECETECLRVTGFVCKIYSFRLGVTGANYGRNQNNCDMTNKEPRELDPFRDLVGDRDSDLHERVRFGRDCEAAPSATNVLTPGSVPRQCFLRTRVGIRLDRRMVRFTIPVNSPLECEQECLRSRYFTCRSFSFRKVESSHFIGRLARFADSASSSDAWHKATDNCDLSDTDVKEADPTRDLVDDRNYDTWQRSSYSDACNSGSGYGSGFNIDAGAVNTGTGMGGTQSPSWGGQGVVSTGVWVHSGTVDKQNGWGTDSSATGWERDKPNFSSEGSNTNVGTSGSGWMKPKPGNAWVTLTGNTAGSDLSLGYGGYGYGGQSEYGVSSGSWSTKPANGWGSGSAGNSDYPRRPGYESSTAPNYGSGYGDSWSRPSPDRNEPSTHVGSGDSWSRPNSDRERPSVNMGSGSAWSRPNLDQGRLPTNVYRPEPDYGYGGSSTSPSSDPWPRPFSTDREHPSIMTHRPDSGYGYGSSDGSTNSYEYNQEGQWNKPTTGDRNRPFYTQSNYGSSGSYPGFVVGIGTASLDKDKPSWDSGFDGVNEIKPSGCYVSYRSGVNFNRRVVRSSLSVRSLAECEAECSRSRNFNCRTLSFRLTDISGGFSRNRNNCFLSDIETRSLDKYRDLTEDRDFHLFTRSLYSRECEDSVTSPIMSSSGEGLTVTVSGARCRAGSRCKESREAGYWSCETGPDSWDYCCRPNHVCGYTSGFNYPWCYVGGTSNSMAKDQWRPCSDRFAERPYAYLHREGPPSANILESEPRNGTETLLNSTLDLTAISSLVPLHTPVGIQNQVTHLNSTRLIEEENPSVKNHNESRSRSEEAGEFAFPAGLASFQARQESFQWPIGNATSTLPTTTEAEDSNTEEVTSVNRERSTTPAL